MATKHFDIPDFHFFEEKNIFSGSMSKHFNYKIWYGEQFIVKVWYGEKCFSCTPESEIVAELTLDFVSESVEKIDLWLKEQYEIYAKVHENSRS